MIILKPLWFNKHLKECNWTSLVILKAKLLFVTGLKLNVKLVSDLILIVFLGQLTDKTWTKSSTSILFTM